MTQEMPSTTLLSVFRSEFSDMAWNATAAMAPTAPRAAPRIAAKLLGSHPHQYKSVAMSPIAAKHSNPPTQRSDRVAIFHGRTRGDGEASNCGLSSPLADGNVSEVMLNEEILEILRFQDALYR